MSRPFARFVLVLLSALLALMTSPTARAADNDEGGATPPRDVTMMVQPSAAKLPPVPDDFQRLDDGWLVLEFPSSVRGRVEPLATEAADLRARLSAHLGQAVLQQALVRVARSPEQMAALAPEGAPPPAYAAGVAYPSVHLAILALQAPDTWEAPDLPELLAHELTHLALTDAVAGHHMPRWFDEGLAIQESGEVPWARTKTLWDASLARRLLPLSDLDRGFPTDRYEVNIAYAEAADFVRFLMRDSDRARFGSLIERVRDGSAFDVALSDAYGTDGRRLEYEWREEIGRRFGLLPVLTGGGALWTLIAALLVVAWVKRRRRSREKLAQWAREEAEMDLAPRRWSESSKPVCAIPLRRTMTFLPPSIPGVPVVEHEGRWYTLH